MSYFLFNKIREEGRTCLPASEFLGEGMAARRGKRNGPNNVYTYE
jgi:hypothetical protein